MPRGNFRIDLCDGELFGGHPMTNFSPNQSVDSYDVDRKRREAEFHDLRYSDDQRAGLTVLYEGADFKQAYSDLVVRRAKRKTVLELGCGLGNLGLTLASQGAQVVPIDISFEAARQSQTLGGADVIQAPVVGDAEKTPFFDGAFDLVIGSGIVHHLDIGKLLPEVRRLLSENGEAIFMEPLGTNPFINAFRKLTPRMRTVDERPLTRSDLRAFDDGSDVEVTIDYFFVSQLIGSAYALASGRPVPSRLSSTLKSVDYVLTRSWNPLRWLSWMVVINMRKV